MAEQSLTRMSAEEAAAKRAEFESGAAADPGNVKLWTRYVSFELANGGGIEAGRALYERALAALPDPSIENYLYWSWSVAERDFGDVDGQRRVLEQWVGRLPRGGGLSGRQGWEEYLEFEVGNGGVERVRAVAEALLKAFPMDPFAYVLYVRALAALSRHLEAFTVAKSGIKKLSGWCPGHDEYLRRFMAEYIKRLKTKQSTAWDDSDLWE